MNITIFEGGGIKSREIAEYNSEGVANFSGLWDCLKERGSRAYQTLMGWCHHNATRCAQ